MEKDRFSWKHSLLLILAGIALNLLGAQLALYFKLPIFLDAIGTIAAAMLGGYLPGIIVGFFSNYINSLSDPVTLYYGIISVIFAVGAASFSRRGVFRRLWSTLLSALFFAAVGGGLGSLLTWALYGLDIGSGISSPYALALYGLGFDKFSAQLSADLAIDLVDKLVTVLLIFFIPKLLPDKLLKSLPYGCLYLHGSVKEPAKLPPLPTLASLRSRRTYRRRSLSNKVALLIIITALILGALSASISFILYRDNIERRYEEMGQTAVGFVQKAVDADLVGGWLAGGRDADYDATEAALYELKDSLPAIEYMYVYRILPDGCHVVFDLDTADVAASGLGDVVGFDYTFEKYLPALLAGDEVPPIIASGQFGWLLTVYRPLRDASGATAAYAAVDIAMEDVISNNYVFVIRVISLMFGASIIIVAFAIWYAQRRLVNPLNALSAATSKLAYDSIQERQANTERLKALDIRTGDEIEYLYSAIAKTTEDVSSYLSIIDSQRAEVESKAQLISKLQDNIIIAFATMVENRDENTGSHIKRTATYVSALGEALHRRGLYAGTLTEEYLEDLRRSAPLHDIGKIKIPDYILNKPGRLTPDEFNVIKSHTTEGKLILQEVLEGIEGESYLSEAIAMAAYHHERWDGTGYPEGLSGEAIPLCARIMALADVLDALLSRRSYKEAYSFGAAVDIIVAESGTHFDPTIVAVFVEEEESMRALSEA